MQSLKKLGSKVREVTIGGKEVAVSESPVGFLGRVLWYSVYELAVAYDEFLESLKDAEIPEELHPGPTRPVDAFKKAVRDQESSEYLVTKDVIEKDGKRETIPNSLVVARRMRDTEVADLPVLVRARYDEGDLTFVGKRGSDEAKELISSVEERFAFHKDHVNASDIRMWLNRAVKAMLPVQLKSSGGVYFVPEKWGDMVESLARVMDELTPLGPGTEFITLPVVDRQPERSTILFKYETVTTQRLRELAVRAVQWHKEGKELYPSQFAKIQEEYEYIVRQRRQYEQLLETASVSVETELDVLRKAMVQLSENIKEGS